jgi:dihydroorotase
VELVQEKPVSIKVYCDQTPSCSENLKQIYKWIKSSNLAIPLTVHAESHAIITKQLATTEEPHDLEWFSRVRGRQAEIQQVREIIELMLDAGIPTHICHVSCAETVDLVIEARRKGLPLSTEVTPHHLELSWKEIRTNIPSGFFKVNPPLRMKRDNQVLLKALKEGTLNMVASDHAPHTQEEKVIQDLASVPSGIVGTELILPLVLTYVHNKILSLERAVQITSSEPAKVFNLPSTEIIQGNSANFCIVDPNEKWTIQGSDFHGATKFTPFEGKAVIGKVHVTVVNGALVYKDGEVIHEARNPRFIHPLPPCCSN